MPIHGRAPRERQHMQSSPIALDPAHADELIRDHIEQDPGRPGPAEARLVHFATPVWAIIGYLQVADWSTHDAAVAYDIPEDVVLAAIAYYQRHRGAIDARLEANHYATA